MQLIAKAYAASVDLMARVRMDVGCLLACLLACVLACLPARLTSLALQSWAAPSTPEKVFNYNSYGMIATEVRCLGTVPLESSRETGLLF